MAKLIFFLAQIIIIGTAIATIIVLAKREREKKRKIDPFTKKIDEISNAALAATLADLESKTEQIKQKMSVTVKESDLAPDAKAELEKIKKSNKPILLG